MSNRPFTRAIAALLVVSLMIPATFLVVPQRAVAQSSIISCLLGSLGSAASLVTSFIGVPVVNPSLPVTAGATTGSCIYEAILKPIARAIARMILAQITASVINWITGKNGSGKAMFVQSISLNLQGVGDAVALPFISMVRTGFNSPFGPSIASALQLQYNQQTSLAGFFAANQSTLARYSPNQNAFLAGDWSQGGIPAWFALTTQCQNNPYCLDLAAQSQLGSTVGQSQTNRRQDLIQSSGFLSWCGASSGTAPSSGGRGVNPGDSCTNADGTPGRIQTPGSVIHDYTQKAVVAAGIDQLISAQDLDAALGAIAMTLVNQVLSGSGLFGASAPSGARPAVTAQLQSYSTSNASAATAATSLAQTVQSNISAYTGAWNTISAAANSASASLTSLANFCTAAAAAATGDATFVSAATVQASAAQLAITSEIAPVLAQAQTAINSVNSTRALILQTQQDAVAVTAGTSGAGGALSADTQALSAAPPSGTDIASAQAKATVTNSAAASPVGSVSVSGGSLVDQMNLIKTNAVALQTSVCTQPVSNP